jgi:hypothetical protein
MNSTADAQAEMPVPLWRRRVSAAAISGKIPQRLHNRPQGMLDSDRHPVGWSRLCCPSRPSPRGDVACGETTRIIPA